MISPRDIMHILVTAISIAIFWPLTGKLIDMWRERQHDERSE